mmetsp:Transcript_1755/g.3310  ORF Transcript_1755/g.3310 Transcript_1755/m.3310 type:complete len:277 (+) Transcript_1755:424-1254(+)
MDGTLEGLRASSLRTSLGASVSVERPLVAKAEYFSQSSNEPFEYARHLPLLTSLLNFRSRCEIANVNSGNPGEYRYKSTSRFNNTNTSFNTPSNCSIVRNVPSLGNFNINGKRIPLTEFLFLFLPPPLPFFLPLPPPSRRGFIPTSFKSNTPINRDVVGMNVSVVAASCCSNRTQWRRNGTYRAMGTRRHTPKIISVNGYTNERSRLASSSLPTPPPNLSLAGASSSSPPTLALLPHAAHNTATHNFKQCTYCQQSTTLILSGVRFIMALRRCNAN